jgi:hypothetical protein
MAPLRKYSPVSAKFNNRCAFSRDMNACHLPTNAWRPVLSVGGTGWPCTCAFVLHCQTALFWTEGSG